MVNIHCFYLLCYFLHILYRTVLFFFFMSIIQNFPLLCLNGSLIPMVILHELTHFQSLRLHWYPWPIVGCEERLEVGAQTQQPGCGRPSIREAERTPAGFRKAVHCWTPTKGRSYCWIRSLSICYGFFCTLIWCSPIMLSITSLYNCRRVRVMLFVILYLWDIWEDMHCCWDFSDLGKKRMVSYDISNPDAREFPSQVVHKPYLITSCGCHTFKFAILWLTSTNVKEIDCTCVFPSSMSQLSESPQGFAVGIC